ncbi:MAG: IS4 family transposase [Deltaproteobacteria bacterium]|nr:MAG: IS4 family transposase [Deltaproteobacteria bacterium]RLC08841.1 MAG: IS4 family transposase [Deltaproteobacteria bacterium]
MNAFLLDLFEFDIHAKRVYSLANATLGVMSGESLAIHTIGQGLAQARGLVTKHAIKQVDRLLSNNGVDVWEMFKYWVPEMIGQRKDIVVAMDWTDYDADDQSTIAINLVTSHGRATPLIWKTVVKSTLRNNRNRYEDEVLTRFKEVLPPGVKVVVLADRGFGDHKLMHFLRDDLEFDFVIRIRSNILVEDEKGEERRADEWVGKGGRARMLRNASITHKKYEVPTVVCVHAKDMKEPWCLVASFRAEKSKDLAKYYAKRWSIEPSFRDTKDLRFGMGLSSIHIKSPERRDRLLLISAFAVVLLTVLGAAGEALGLDRLLKANTVKHRVHSLFRQGCMWYELIPNMPEERLRMLMGKFGELMNERNSFKKVYGYV